jgi:probable addiction module antidote protein
MLAGWRPRLGAKAKDTGLTREGLYRSLSADGNPEFATILKVVKALGLSLQVGSS